MVVFKLIIFFQPFFTKPLYTTFNKILLKTTLS